MGDPWELIWEGCGRLFKHPPPLLVSDQPICDVRQLLRVALPEQLDRDFRALGGIDGTLEHALVSAVEDLGDVRLPERRQQDASLVEVRCVTRLVEPLARRLDALEATDGERSGIDIDAVDLGNGVVGAVVVSVGGVGHTPHAPVDTVSLDALQTPDEIGVARDWIAPL